MCLKVTSGRDWRFEGVTKFGEWLCIDILLLKSFLIFVHMPDVPLELCIFATWAFSLVTADP